MIQPRIIAIVEGDGEVKAVPVLLRRYVDLLGWSGRLNVSAIRQPASKLLRVGELERVLELVARKLGGRGGILVLLDCDEGCPAELAPPLLQRMRRARPDIPSSLVLARREFEAWFLASAESLAGRRGLSPSLRAPPDPESIRGCKEWLSDRMMHGATYNAVTDQPALASVFDLEASRSASPSFDKFHREVESLVGRIAALFPSAPESQPGGNLDSDSTLS